MRIYNEIRKISSGRFNLLLISIILYSFIIYNLSPPWKPLGWDEVDFFNASTKGIIENAFESSSLGFSYSLKLLLYKLGLSEDNSLPIGYLETQDIFLLRHFHPPLLQYLTFYFSFIDRLDLRLAEVTVFASRYFLGIFLIVSSFQINKKIFKNKISLFRDALNLSIYVYAALLLTQYFQYHLLLAITLICVSLSLTNLVNNINKKNLFINALALTFCLLSLETALVILISSISIFFLLGLRNRILISKLLREILVYFLFVPFLLVFIFWPASITNTSILKTYALYAYRVFFINKEYSRVFTLDILRSTTLPALPLLITGLFTLLLIAYFIRTKNNIDLNINGLVVTSFLGLTYFIFITPFALNSTYSVPGLLILSLPFGNIIEIISGKLIKILQVSTIGMIISFLPLLPNLLSGNLNPYPDINSIMTLGKFMESNDNLILYADGSHVFKFYLPELSHKINYLAVNEIANNKGKLFRKLYSRKNNEYQEIKITSINRPSIFVVRNDYKKVFSSEGYKCEPLELNGLKAEACLLK